MCDDVFEYNKNLTYLQNFLKWKHLNDTENENYNQPKLTAEESAELFETLYGDYA